MLLICPIVCVSLGSLGFERIRETGR